MATGLVSLLLASSLVVVPIVGFVFAPLALVPVLRLEGATGRSMAAWLPVLVILGVVAATQPEGIAVHLWAAYALLVALPAVSVRWWLRLGGSDGRWMAATVLSLAGLVLLGATVASAPQSPVDGLRATADTAFVEAEAAWEAMGTSMAGNRLWVDQTIRLAPWLIPGAIVGYAVIVLFWIRPRLPVLGFDLPVGPFETYRSDDWLPVVFAITGGGALALSGTPRWIAVNLLVAVMILYFVHGLAIIRAYLARWIGRGFLVRWVVAFLALQMPMPAVVAVLGMVDTFKPLRPRTTEDDNEHDGNPE